MSAIWTVRELTRKIRCGLEERFPFVWVRGEVGNLSRPASGHVYFSLKDEEALLNCVWFKSAVRADEDFDPLTGEVYPEGPHPSLANTLQEGQEILCAGRISVYAPRGAYQLVVELAQPDGVGRLALLFEALKQKLAARGYFDLGRKRRLPAHPVRTAVITAPGGAAVRDFARIASERGWGGQIRIYPVPVQGRDASAAVAETLARVNAEGWAEVAVLIRGGGSLEDLWAFNEEAVADAVFASAVPVLTGIGHESDTSLADLTADVRAATPSHAAQLLWPLRTELVRRLDETERGLRRVSARHLRDTTTRLGVLEWALRRLSPVAALARREERYRRAAGDLRRAAGRFTREQGLRLAFVRERLAGARELSIRERSGHLELACSRLRGLRLFEDKARLLENVRLRLRARAQVLPVRAERALEAACAALTALNPYAPLERGYALIRDSRGRLVRSVCGLRPGDALALRLRDGIAEAEVTALRESGESL